MTPQQQEAFAAYAASFGKPAHVPGRGGRPAKTARNKAVLKLIRSTGQTYAQIGKRFGMSKSAVQGVAYRAGAGRNSAQ